MQERVGRILVVCGRDDASILALRRAASFVSMLGARLAVLFLVPDDTPAARYPDRAFLLRFAEQASGLVLGTSDVEVAPAAAIGARLAREEASPPALVLCPAAADCTSEAGSLNLRSLWARTARLAAPLLVTRRDVHPRRVVVASDGTPRTLPVLERAFALAGHEHSPLTYVDTMRIPLMVPRDLWPEERARPRPIVRLSEGDGVGSLATHAARVPGAPIGALPRIAKVCARLRADTLVVGASAQESHVAEELIESVSCSVLVVPTAAP